MAGIEKICEYSGDYEGGVMYGYKHNQLQIMPKYRKLFRGAEHTLYIQFNRLNWMYKRGGYTEYDPVLDDEEYRFYMKGRIVPEYNYKLVVTDENLLGQVNGEYLNHTNHLPTVKRKLKRLLRCRELNIVFVEDLKDDYSNEL
jgi:hypothetical protein